MFLITSTYKSSSRADTDNYKGVCISSTIDDIVAEILLTITKNIFNEDLDGFLDGRLSSINLFLFTEHVKTDFMNSFAFDYSGTNLTKPLDFKFI